MSMILPSFSYHMSLMTRIKVTFYYSAIIIVTWAIYRQLVPYAIVISRCATMVKSMVIIILRLTTLSPNSPVS